MSHAYPRALLWNTTVDRKASPFNGSGHVRVHVCQVQSCNTSSAPVAADYVACRRMGMLHAACCMSQDGHVPSHATRLRAADPSEERRSDDMEGDAGACARTSAQPRALAHISTRTRSHSHTIPTHPLNLSGPLPVTIPQARRHVRARDWCTHTHAHSRAPAGADDASEHVPPAAQPVRCEISLPPTCPPAHTLRPTMTAAAGPTTWHGQRVPLRSTGSR